MSKETKIQIKSVQVNITYQIRTEQLDGHSYLVVPVVMMVEGVHSGSHGPILHTIDELGKYTGAWDGRPVTIGHPERDGHNVSANSPDVVERETVGAIYNTHVDGQKLKAEAWLRIDLMEQRSPQALAYIRQQRPLDVSVGVFTDNEQVSGTYGNETYNAIARNHRPDHLALLPDAVGACSWNDGCGIRVNKQEGGNVSTLQEYKQKQMEANPFIIDFVQTNETDYQELGRRIQSKLDAMDSDTRVHWLRALYESYCIYEVRSADGSKYYKREYEVMEDGSIELMNEPIEVRKEVSFVAMEQMKRKKKMNNNKTKEVETMSEVSKCCPDKVDALIAHEGTQFTESDKDWLLTQSVETIEKMFPKEQKPVQSNEISSEQVIEAYKQSVKTAEEFINAAPEEMRESLKHGLTLHKEKRTALIDGIVANSEFEKDELAAYDITMLEKLHRSTAKKDYSVVGRSIQANEVNDVDVDDLLPPIGVEFETK